MDETQPREPRRHREEQFEDEIELMDYLRVIWKWKYLIIAGTLICAIAAGAVSFSQTKVYRIDTVVQPGILGINEAGNKVYVDSPENVKALIEVGAFDRPVLDNIGESNNNGWPKSLNLEVNIPTQSNVLKVSYETSNVDRGLQILNSLGKVLLTKYGERVTFPKKEYETQIALNKSNKADCEAERRASKKHIKNIQKRIDELTSQSELIKENTNSLIQERDKFLSDNTGENNILSAVLYTNTIQQNIALQNGYKQQINYYITRRRDEKLKLVKLNGELDRLVEEIKGLEFKKNNVRNIEILQPATAGPYPINPKIKLNVMLATVVGLFAMLFLAFFLEYIQKHKGKLES